MRHLAALLFAATILGWAAPAHAYTVCWRNNTQFTLRVEIGWDVFFRTHNQFLEPEEKVCIGAGFYLNFDSVAVVGVKAMTNKVAERSDDNDKCLGAYGIASDKKTYNIHVRHWYDGCLPGSTKCLWAVSCHKEQ